MQFPELDLENFTIKDNIDFGVLINKKTEAEFRIETLDILFLRCIDGNKSVSEIHDEISVLLDCEISYEAVWKAFDNLSDIGVLKNRLSPPAGGQTTSRRKFIRNFSATAAATGAVLTASPSFAQTEQESKQASEGLAKRQQEQAAKFQAEQNFKNPQSEQDTKNAAEESQKEQQTKTSAESAQKEQSSKMSAESAQKEQSQKISHEQSSKEAAVKGGGGGNPAASVPEPDTLTLFGLGLASLALLRKRANNVVKNKEAEDES